VASYYCRAEEHRNAGKVSFWPVVPLAGHNNNWHAGHVER
jgi:hypothetical protein